jgi:uncharacterized protein YrrD
MNKSILSVYENTSDSKVMFLADVIIRNRGKRFLAIFVKKDGTVREMEFVPRNEYNRIMGVKTTDSGRNMVAAKCAQDMITVVEFMNVDSLEVIQPRTINLRKVIELRVAA